ncbi:hypothetical protein TWF696_007914 [Orbilia brochopaga]|uniref:Uncharacterized protein n=1 Tax=Orbilia brochopaga TaxID=3140254 RepID=A0AAV9UPY9_9PEZI
MPGKKSSKPARSSKKDNTKGSSRFMDKVMKKLRSLKPGRTRIFFVRRHGPQKKPAKKASSGTRKPQSQNVPQTTTNTTPLIRCDSPVIQLPDSVATPREVPTDGAATELFDITPLEIKLADYLASEPDLTDEGIALPTEDNITTISVDASQHSSSTIAEANSDTENTEPLTLTTPFNLWKELMQTVDEIGVTRDQVNGDILRGFIADERQSALWDDDRAIAMFTRERDAYEAAIAYIVCVTSKAPKPRNAKQKQAWDALTGYDFRLSAVVKYLEKSILQMKEEKEKCRVRGHQGRERKAADLIRALEETLDGVEELKDAIVRRLLGKLEDVFFRTKRYD